MAARIVHVLGETGVGGAENQARYLLQALQDQGVAPELVFFRKGRNHDLFEAVGSPMHQIAARRRFALDWHRRARAMARLLSARPPDILHTWLYETHLVGLTAASRWPETRVVLAHRSGLGVPGTRKQLLALRPVRGRIDHVVTNSPAGAELMIDFGVASERVSVIGNGFPSDAVAVDRDRDTVRRDLGIPPSAPLICSVTRPDPAKDLANLFAAFRTVRAARPETQLLLVGPAPAELLAHGTPLVPGSHAIGFQSSPSTLMNAADVVAVSSRTEGHSNVAAEALMLGMPVATTNTGAHSTVVAKAGGLVVPVGNSPALAEALLTLLDAPPTRETVRAVAVSELSIAGIARDTIELYERLLAERQPRFVEPAAI